MLSRKADLLGKKVTIEEPVSYSFGCLDDEDLLLKGSLKEQGNKRKIALKRHGIRGRGRRRGKRARSGTFVHRETVEPDLVKLRSKSSTSMRSSWRNTRNGKIIDFIHNKRNFLSGVAYYFLHVSRENINSKVDSRGLEKDDGLLISSG